MDLLDGNDVGGGVSVTSVKPALDGDGHSAPAPESLELVPLTVAIGLEINMRYKLSTNSGTPLKSFYARPPAPILLTALPPQLVLASGLTMSTPTAAVIDAHDTQDNCNDSPSSPSPDGPVHIEPSTPPSKPLEMSEVDNVGLASSPVSKPASPVSKPASSVLPATPAPPASPASSTTSSVSSVSSLTPSTPPSMLRRANVHYRAAARLASPEPVDGGNPAPDEDFEGLVSSFAGWRLQSTPATPASFSSLRQVAPDDASFTRTVSAVRRQQNDLKKLVESLENELAQVHSKVSESLDTSTNLLLRTQELISSERKNMEKRHESTAYNIGSLETKLNKAQRHIATLQAQHIADKGLIDQLVNEIAALWDRQEEIGGRLQRAEETEQHVRQLAERLRELMREVRERECEIRRGLSTVIPTLADELGLDQTPSAQGIVEPALLRKLGGLLWDIVAEASGDKRISVSLQAGIAVIAAQLFDTPAMAAVAVWFIFLTKHLLAPLVIALLVYAALFFVYEHLANVCLLGTYENDRGEQVPGTLQLPRTRQLHALADRKREIAAVAAAQDARAVESSIMLATMATGFTAPTASSHSTSAIEDGSRSPPAPAVHATEASAMQQEHQPMSVDEEEVAEPTHAAERKQRRISELSAIESRLHHRSRRVTKWTQLVFESAPQTSLDKVVPLAPNIPGNVEFESYRRWIHEEIERFHTELLPIEERDADQRRLRLLRWLESELRRLNGLEEYCWDRAKILARLPGFYFLPDEDEPLIIRPRE
ncbi:hypothetical protein C8Q70DRAFT_934897 [Cubamyces menziesii]|nr:hypothetical protein C8Q70DRAFT_934897 [Cubamyces menziesii]